MLKANVEQGGSPAPVYDKEFGGDKDGVVTVRALSKTYGGRRGSKGGVLAVDNVDLTVGSGELVVLLGPSGCGKTTLLRSIAGLEMPDRGEIGITGTTVFSDARKINIAPEARRIGMMFQSYALWPHMTVFQNISYPLRGLAGYGRDRVHARVADLLDRLGISGLDARYPGELSGGQAQRVALARALAAEPSILLFDEPLSNVDAKVRRLLRAELRDLKKATGFAGVYVTHDQEEAMELADRLAVMKDGRIAQIATTREVYRQPASVYVASFVGEINRWKSSARLLPEGHLEAESELGTFTLRGATPKAPPQADGWLMVRPERVDIRPVGSDNGRLRGRVLDAIYFGSRYEFRVRLDNGVELLAYMSDDRGREHLPLMGDEVCVEFDEEALQWLPE